MRRGLVVIFCLLLLLHVLPAQVRRQRGPSRPEFFKAYQSHTSEEGRTRAVLRNGMVLLIDEHPTAPVMTVVTAVPHQSTAEQRRLAELTSSILSTHLGRRSKELGGFAETNCSINRCLYVGTYPAAQLVRALDAQRGLLELPEDGASWLDFLVESRFRQEALRLENPLETARSQSLSPETPPTQAEETAPDVSWERLVQFHQQAFQPAKLKLVVGGSVREDQVMSRVVDLYAEKQNLGKSKVVTGPDESSEEQQFQYRQQRADVGQAYLLATYPAPPSGSRDRQVLEIVLRTLGNGPGEVATRALEEDQGVELTYRFEETARGHFLTFQMATPLEELDAVEARFFGLLELLGEKELPAPLWALARARSARDYFVASRRTDWRVVALAEAELRGDWKSEQGRLDLYADLQSREGRSVASKYLNRQKVSLIEILPLQAEPRTLTGETLQETLKVTVPANKEKTLAALTVAAEQSVDVADWNAFEPRVGRESLKRTSVLRGPEIFLEESHRAPLVQLGVFFAGGRINETADQSGLTELALAALLENLIRERPQQWASIQSGGGELRIVNEKDFFGFELTTLSGSVRQVLQSLVSWLREPEIAARDVQRARARLLIRSTLAVDTRSPVAELQLDLRRRLFPSHPYSRSRFEVAEQVLAADPDMLERWLSQELIQIHPYIFAAGDLQGTSFLAPMVSQLSDASFSIRRRVRNMVPAETLSDGKPILSTEGSRQALGIYGAHEDSPAMEVFRVADQLLNGEGGMLQRVLQKEQQLADRIIFYSQGWVNSGLVWFYLESDSEKKEEAVSALRKLLGELLEQGVPRRIFLNSVVGTVTRFHLQQQFNRSYLKELMRATLSGEPPDFQEQELLRLKSLRPRDLPDAMGQFFVIP